MIVANLVNTYVLVLFSLVVAGAVGWSAAQGGGGTLMFSSYVGSGPASYVHPKNCKEFQASQKNI